MIQKTATLLPGRYHKINQYCCVERIIHTSAWRAYFPGKKGRTRDSALTRRCDQLDLPAPPSGSTCAHRSRFYRASWGCSLDDFTRSTTDFRQFCTSRGVGRTIIVFYTGTAYVHHAKFTLDPILRWIQFCPQTRLSCHVENLVCVGRPSSSTGFQWDALLTRAKSAAKWRSSA